MSLRMLSRLQGRRYRTLSPHFGASCQPPPQRSPMTQAKHPVYSATIIIHAPRLPIPASQWLDAFSHTGLLANTSMFSCQERKV